MNKQDKIICFLLVLALGGWLWHSFDVQKKQAAALAKERAAAAEQVGPTQAAASALTNAAAAAVQAPVSSAKPEARQDAAAPTVHVVPEKTLTLANDEMELVVSSRGAVAKQATMKGYNRLPGAASEVNGPLVFDFGVSPLFALEGVDALPADADYEVSASGADWVEFKTPVVTRRITLAKGYQVRLAETFAKPGADAHALSIGAMEMGSSKNDVLSIDSMSTGAKPEVEHHGETDPLKGYLVGASGGCSGTKSAEGIPETSVVDVVGRRAWLAVKNRFFVTALASCSVPNGGFRVKVVRDVSRREYALKGVGAAATFDAVPEKRESVVYLGPKKQALLWDLGMKDVMEFGMWRWVCYPLVWLLNLFHGWIPSFGVGIILLTFLVRIVFWPLTHKSTIGMRKMQEIQPKIKALREKFKDNPQRLQQETWQCYRENKVNPMSSCLPMLVQIPVFIALFTVLRSAVELRYAPFLWIADLSEPEALFASWFPFGGLNVLPILMAATMALQSALTPSTGDKQQQRMMMVMMPAMMLVMFYNFPSALSLYWTLSQVLSIVQMWWIRKQYAAPTSSSGDVLVPDAVEMPVTRQMRRHAGAGLIAVLVGTALLCAGCIGEGETEFRPTPGVINVGY